MDHSKKFEEVRRVQPFGWSQLARLESERVIRACIIRLLQDGVDRLSDSDCDAVCGL